MILGVPVGLSLAFSERATGGFWRFDEPAREHPLRFHLRATAPRVERPLTFRVTGDFSADGLVDAGTLTGTITAPRAWMLEYRLNIVKDGAVSLVLHGAKHNIHRDLYAGMTTLAGTLSEPDASSPFARFVSRFDARGDVRWWLRNLHVGASLDR
ncbi:MAG: hypothetical protein U0271_41675 [Polyangiaceae bacterium]